jgi:hypothetical protein
MKMECIKDSETLCKFAYLFVLIVSIVILFICLILFGN